jgi:hypothetical protein
VKSKKPYNLSGFIFGALRRVYRFYPAKKEALKRAAGTGKDYYRCLYCGNYEHIKNIQIDHRDPVIDPKVGFTTWDNYIARLFCSVENLDVLCKPCHYIKTKEENRVRRVVKKDKKK